MTTNTIEPEEVGRAYALLSMLPYAKPLDAQIAAALVATFRAAGVSGPELLEAAAWAAQTQQAWPAPATLIGRVRDSRERTATGAIETAEEAWGAVRAAMESGWHDSGGKAGPFPPTMSPRARGAFLSALGTSWSAFWSAALPEDMISHRSRFVDAYRSSSTLDRQLLEHERVKREAANMAVAGLWEQRLAASAQRAEIETQNPAPGAEEATR